jgi:hypothetical protein
LEPSASLNHDHDSGFIQESETVISKEDEILLPVTEIPQENDVPCVENLDFSGANSPCPSVSSENTCSISNAPSVNQEDHLGLGESNDWRRLFKTNNSLGKLNFVAPRMLGNKVMVSSPLQDVEDGIPTWKTSLVGQFLDKPLPFYLVKKSVALM